MIGFAIYIFLGSIFLTKMYQADGLERIPHVTFWMGYPALVMDGVNLIRDFIGGSSSAVGLERLSAYSAKPQTTRDPFSQFDPI